MEPSQLSWIANFIWGIADDVLRDLYVRGKYRDVILPMTVLRRLDAVLEPTKHEVLTMKAALDGAGIANQDEALRQAAAQPFYNTSKFTLRDLRSRGTQQALRADFEAFLDGFSPNVQEILDNFEFRNQIPRLSKADALGTLIEKLLSPEVNLSPFAVKNGDGSVRHPGLDNHGMGTIFEELVRRFNEENNEEAGEHWTPRDAVRVMAKLIFLPIADQIESGTYLLYDGACGTGGMLTVAEETLQALAKERAKQVATHLYGQEINAETYAIAKADLLLHGEGEAADNLVGGPEHSTLANDAFPSREFDFMLSNPPYGKSWKSDLERMGGKEGIKDPRFLIEHAGDGEYSLLTRSSDGQMLFLANLVSKMKRGTKLGSRIAEVHNGSSLFTGDAGQGESNIRRWIVENDWLEAIVALPLNMFYNTGIATYVWVLTNRKPAHRQGKVQLIDASGWYRPLRKNLGKKNCELSPEDVDRICETFLRFEETDQSKIFPNAAFGYSKLTVERPLRLPGIDPARAYTPKEIKVLKAERVAVAGGAAEDGAEPAPAVIRKIHKAGYVAADPLRGRFSREGRRPARRRRVRARLRPARQRAGATPGAGRHRLLPHPRGAAACPRRLVRPGERQGGLRDQLHPLLLQAEAAPVAGRDPRRHRGVREGNRRAAGGDIGALGREGEGRRRRGVRKVLRPYPRMKDSGVPWLGEVPEHWEVRRFKGLFTKCNRPANESDKVVTCFRDGTVTQRKKRRSTGFTEALKEIGYQGICRGDLVVHGMDAFAGAIGVADSDGKGSPVYSVLTATSRSDPSFFSRVVREMSRTDWIIALAKGIRERSTDFRFETLAQQSVVLPPLVEQRSIARFLDHADHRIRRCIHAKQKLIALLEEQKQSLIEVAVTRGLARDVALGSSGTSWLGDVPRHWVVASLRFRYEQCLGKMVDAKAATGRYPTPYLRNVDVRWDRVNVFDLPVIDIRPEERERYTLRPGDLLVCEGRHLGRSAFWRGDLPVCGFQKALHRLRALDSSRDSPRFMYYCLYLAHVRDAFDASSFDTSIPHLTGEMLRAHRFPFPPFAEQQAIAAYLDDVVAESSNAVERVAGEIALLREYRTRLIADVVTGKLDVREAAANLPDDDPAVDEDTALPEAEDTVYDDPDASAGEEAADDET